MIELSNGHQMDFVVASGALGFDGRGWWFEQPWRWLGLLRPQELTIITKTLTRFRREGNLKMWHPWTCVRPVKGGWVNAVGLTNPGIKAWVDKFYPSIVSNGYNAIVSIAPETEEEVEDMIEEVNSLQVVGVELNVSCPNTDHDDSVEHIVQMTNLAVNRSRHPVILKLSYDQPWLECVKRLDGVVAAFDLINSVAWKTAGVGPSPLRQYGLVGGVSGPRIKSFAREALAKWAEAVPCHAVRSPVISGGGIDSYAEAKERFKMGANAVSFGTIFITRPWLPNQIAARWRKKFGKPSVT